MKRRLEQLEARDSLLPALPAAGRVARGGGGRPAEALPRRGVLGAPGGRLRRPAGAARDRRPRPGRPRRQPHRADVHRRSLRRLALRGAAPRRARQPADVGRSRRRAPARATPTSPRSSAARRPPTGRPRTSATTACPIWSASSSCCGDCRTMLALGSFAWDGTLRALRDLGAEIPRPKPRFGHGAEAEVGRLDAARLLPPEPAEHVHRQADRADARRRLRPRR